MTMTAVVLLLVLPVASDSGEAAERRGAPPFGVPVPPPVAEVSGADGPSRIGWSGAPMPAPGADRESTGARHGAARGTVVLWHIEDIEPAAADPATDGIPARPSRRRRPADPGFPEPIVGRPGVESPRKPPRAASDTLRLGTLQRAAIETDPRGGQSVLRDREHELRLENIAAERLPGIGATAEITRQSDVPTIPVAAPGHVPTAPLTRYEVAVEADQLVYDGGALGAREAAEVARRAEAAAELEATLYPLRIEVTEAYFAALVLQRREREVELLVEDLEARLAYARARVAAGAALPGDTAAVQAERLRALQSLDEIAADRAAAIDVLVRLTGVPIDASDVLEVPDLAAEFDRVRAAGGPGALRERPEFDRLAAVRARLEREAEVVAARTRPGVRAFGRAGIGRPGPFEFFESDLNDFWLVGVRAEWRPWTWGTNARERELLRVQADVAATEEAAFAERLEREVRSDARAIDRLEEALAVDERIVALREQVESQARLQYEEGTITATQYLDARADVFEARETAARHAVELARARARFLTTLGVEIE